MIMEPRDHWSTTSPRQRRSSPTWTCTTTLGTPERRSRFYHVVIWYVSPQQAAALKQ